MRVRDLFEDDGGTIGTVAPGKPRPDAYQNKAKPVPKRPRYQVPPTLVMKPEPLKPAVPAARASPI